MKDWHLGHAEKAVVRFIVGLSKDASEYERRLYKKHGTTASCIRQLEYDMHHGVQKQEIIDIIRKMQRTKKYSGAKSDPGARLRLEELKNYLSGISKEEERFAWTRSAYREHLKLSEGI
jgi:hypothetical protein